MLRHWFDSSGVLAWTVSSLIARRFFTCKYPTRNAASAENVTDSVVIVSGWRSKAREPHDYTGHKSITYTGQFDDNKPANSWRTLDEAKCSDAHGAGAVAALPTFC